MSLSEEFEKQLSDAADAIAIATEEDDTKTDVEDTTDGEATTETNSDDSTSAGDTENQSSDEEGREDQGESGEAADGDQEAGSEAPETGEETDRPAGPSLSDSALNSAVRAGIDIEVARTFKDDATLLKVVEGVRRAVTPKVEKEEKTEEDPFVDLPELDPEEYDEKLIGVFNGMKEVLKKQQEQFRQYKQQGDVARQAAEAAAARELEQWFDSQVSSLGEDFKDTLGDGSMAALNQGSSQYAKRSAIADEMALRLAGLRASGRQIPSREELFQSATKAVLADEYAAIAERKLKSDLAKRSRKHTNRPDSSNGKKTLSPEDEAVELLQEKFYS